jgi:5-(carboxyamino)imidazole ribonucleotide mutase
VGRDAGVRVLICAAGGAAHLAGSVAAQTTLPVIGVPLARTPLGGADALYATVQMPAGIPVATVAIDGAANAALLAAAILALSDPELDRRLRARRAAMAAKVEADDASVSGG